MNIHHVRDMEHKVKHRPSGVSASVWVLSSAMGCDSLLSLLRIGGQIRSKHGDHIVADRITSITDPCRRQG